MHVRLKEVVFHPVDNLDTEERNFRGGLLHVTRNVPVVKLDDYRKEKSPLLKADPLVSTKYVTFNVTKRHLTTCAYARRSPGRWTARRWSRR